MPWPLRWAATLGAGTDGVWRLVVSRLLLWLVGGGAGLGGGLGTLRLGKPYRRGLVSCVTAWKVAKPNVLVMYGAPTDNNATLFGQGYNGVLNPLFSAGTWTKVGTAAGTWDPPTAETEFQGQFTAHKTINSVLPPTTNAAPIITTCRPWASRPRPSR